MAAGTDDNERRALHLWRSAVPLEGTIGENYLGKPLGEAAGVLRFHSSVRYWDRGADLGTWPAIIAAVAQVDRLITGIWRDFLDPATGRRPARLPRPSIGLGRLKGGAIRISHSRPPRILLATSLEAAIALLRSSDAAGATVWAAPGALGVRTLEVPSWCGELVIYTAEGKVDERETITWRRPDHTVGARRNPNFGRRPLVDAAEALTARLVATGVKVEIRYGDQYGAGELEDVAAA